MKRPTKSASATAPEDLAVNSWQNWPGLFFKQRADLSFDWAGRELEQFVGLTAKSLKRSPKLFWAIVHPADADMVRKQIQAAAESGRGITQTFRVCHAPSGRVAHVSEWRRPLLDAQRKVCGYEAFWVDVTRQALAERRLLLSAWKEVLAELTPGLAHDFNNVLTGILALSEGFLAQIDASHSFHEGLLLIKQKAQQASQLVHRIAGLYQDKTGSRSYRDVNSMAAEVAEVLGKVIPKRIEVRAKLAADSLPVYVDAVEFRRVLISLALGAITAMPGRGKLDFQTSRHKTLPRLGQFRGKLSRLPAICLSMANSGGGFAAKQLDSLFDPFATPGEIHEGPALGLHHAWLFVQSSRGAVSVESAPRAGTTFRIWLPEADFTEAEG